MQNYELALKLVKGIAYLLLCAVGGFIVGDELANRLERSNLRAACHEEMAAKIGQEPNKEQALYISFQCRSAIP